MMAQTQLNKVIGEASTGYDPEEMFSRDDDKVSHQKEIAAAHHEMHDAYMADYVSVMRIHFSWTVFYLILVWLIADIYLVVAAGIGSIDLRFLSLAIGITLGSVFGSLCGHACRNKRNIKDLKQLYLLPTKLREDKAARNMQLRVMRSEGSVPCVVVCTILGGCIGYALVTWLVKDVSTPFKMDAPVLLALICTTTTGVLGLFIIVLHWLFPRK